MRVSASPRCREESGDAPDMATKTKIRLLLDANAMQRVGRLPEVRAVRRGRANKRRLRAVYFDTPAADLRQRRSHTLDAQGGRTLDPGPQAGWTRCRWNGFAGVASRGSDTRLESAARNWGAACVQGRTIPKGPGRGVRDRFYSNEHRPRAYRWDTWGTASGFGRSHRRQAARAYQRNRDRTR